MQQEVKFSRKLEVNNLPVVRAHKKKHLCYIQPKGWFSQLMLKVAGPQRDARIEFKYVPALNTGDAPPSTELVLCVNQPLYRCV